MLAHKGFPRPPLPAFFDQAQEGIDHDYPDAGAGWKSVGEKEGAPVLFEDYTNGLIKKAVLKVLRLLGKTLQAK